MAELWPCIVVSCCFPKKACSLWRMNAVFDDTREGARAVPRTLRRDGRG
jgi:hypothetical protein